MDEQAKQRLVKDVEHIKKTLVSMDKTIALQHASLAEHIKRTNLLEQKLEPVEKHVEQVRGVVQFLAWASAIGAALAAFFGLR